LFLQYGNVVYTSPSDANKSLVLIIYAWLSQRNVTAPTVHSISQFFKNKHLNHCPFI